MFGVVYITQAVVKTGNMPKGGRIINVGSISSKMLPQGSNVYSAAKSAQDSMTTAWASEVSSPLPGSYLKLLLTAMGSSAAAMASPSILLRLARPLPTCPSPFCRKLTVLQLPSVRRSLPRQWQQIASELSRTWPMLRCCLCRRRVDGSLRSGFRSAVALRELCEGS